MVCYVKPLFVWKVTPQHVLMLSRQALPILHLLSPSPLNKLIQLKSASTLQLEGEVTPFSPAPRTETEPHRSTQTGQEQHVQAVVWTRVQEFNDLLP